MPRNKPIRPKSVASRKIWFQDIEKIWFQDIVKKSYESHFFTIGKLLQILILIYLLYMKNMKI